jgi:hypothetical protein
MALAKMSPLIRMSSGCSVRWCLLQVFADNLGASRANAWLNEAELFAKDVSKPVRHDHRYNEWQLRTLAAVVSLG